MNPPRIPSTAPAAFPSLELEVALIQSDTAYDTNIADWIIGTCTRSHKFPWSAESISDSLPPEAVKLVKLGTKDSDISSRHIISAGISSSLNKYCIGVTPISQLQDATSGVRVCWSQVGEWSRVAPRAEMGCPRYRSFALVEGLRHPARPSLSGHKIRKLGQTQASCSPPPSSTEECGKEGTSMRPAVSAGPRHLLLLLDRQSTPRIALFLSSLEAATSSRMLMIHPFWIGRGGKGKHGTMDTRVCRIRDSGLVVCAGERMEGKDGQGSLPSSWHDLLCWACRGRVRVQVLLVESDRRKGACRNEETFARDA